MSVSVFVFSWLSSNFGKDDSEDYFSSTYANETLT